MPYSPPAPARAAEESIPSRGSLLRGGGPPSRPDADRPRGAAAVLMVDDTPANLLTLEAVLAPLRHTLVRARSGEEAIRLVGQHAFAVIVLDVMMPGLDGFETAALIRQRFPAQRIPIIFLSAMNREDSDVTRGYAQGAVDYLVKPFNPDILRSKVSVFVELFLQREEIRRQSDLLVAHERERVLAAERQAERDRLHAFLMQAPAAICILRGPEHVFEFANPLYCRMVGKENVVGKPLLEAIPEVRGQGFIEVLDGVLRSGEAFHGPEMLGTLDRRGDGTLEDAYFDIVYAPMRGHTGALEGVMVFAFEVTAQVVARRHKVESQARFRAVFDGAMDGMVIANDEARCVDANPAALALFGLPREELLARRVTETGRMAGHPNAELAWEEFLRTGVQRGQFLVTRPDGSVRTLSFSATANIVPGQHLSVLRDVTEEVMVYEATRRAERRFRALVVATSQIVWTTDAAGEKDEDSPSGRAYTGQSMEEWARVGLSGAIHPEDRPRVDAAWAHAVARGAPFEIEYRLRRHDGQHRHAFCRGVPVVDDEGAVRHWIGTITDVEEQKRLEADIQANLVLRERLLAIVAHDLQNPLAAVTLDADGLGARPDLPPPVVRTAGRIAKSAERMSRMITQLLDRSRGRMGGGIPVELVEETSLSAVCRQAIEELEVARPGRVIVYDEIAPVTGCFDGDRLGEVVSNLVGNALQHGAVGSAVTVRLRVIGDEAVLDVHNLGAPIPEHVFPHLFDPFRRGKRETKSSSLGLGLYIAREIVVAHGGTLTVTSTAEDGTRFTARLPLHGGGAPAPSSTG